MKRLISISLTMLVLISFSILSYSAGDPNMDGGGGGLGGGTSENKWSSGNDGVRVTIIEVSSSNSVSSPIDYTNIHPSLTSYHFGKKSKLNYKNGSSLSLQMSGYTYFNPTTNMPKIIADNYSSSNIEILKKYFCDEGFIRDLASRTGFTYDQLISGNYKLLIEPIAYFKYDNVMYAMTATEAALYNMQLGGDLKAKIGQLTHKNLPLSIFLQSDDLGFSAWKGATNTVISDNEIIAYLGLGIVKFKEDAKPSPAAPDLTTFDYVYRTNTDVITSVLVSNPSSSGISPNEHAYVNFSINGTNYSKGFVMPAGESQLVWVKWHTPNEPQTINISVSLSHGSTAKNTITAKIEKLEEKTPPNPQGRDRNDAFTLIQTPYSTSRKSASWGEWWAWWHEKWVWIENWVDEGYWDDDEYTDSEGNVQTSSSWVSNWVDRGWWEDHGWWVYEWEAHSASLSALPAVKPDERVPTASLGYKWEMKSGYGINIDVDVHVISNAGNYDTTPVQNVVALFPEFEYKTYFRLLESVYGMFYNDKWHLKQNKYSQFNNRVHFTPIWYPDNTQYPVNTIAFDCWTPAGQLYASETDYVNILGNVYDDWYIRPNLKNS
jgi:hypothetical protein